MLPYWRSWFDAWVESAYGSAGFWLHHRPDQHFRTAAGSTPLLAGMVAELLRTDRGIARVVDVGAGNGDLLAGLAEAAPRLGLPDLKLVGIDLRERPAGLPDQVDWVKDIWDVRYGRLGSGAAETAVG